MDSSKVQRLPCSSSRLLTTVVVVLALQAVEVLAAITPTFDAYPLGSQPCLRGAATTSQCTGDTGTELNLCLCGNGGNFVYNSAECIATSSPGDLNSVYATLVSNCAGTGVTLTVSQNAFLAAANAATAVTSSTVTSTTSTRTTSTTSTTSSTRTTSTTPTQSSALSTISTTTGSTTTGTATSSAPSSTSTAAAADSNPESLSTGAKIGIGVGAALGGIALALAAWFIWVYSKKKHAPGAVSTSDRESGYHWNQAASTVFSSPTPGPSIMRASEHAKSPGPTEMSSASWQHPPAGVPHGTGPAWNQHQQQQPSISELGGDTAYPGGGAGYQVSQPSSPPPGQYTNDGSWASPSHISQSYPSHPHSPPPGHNGRGY